MKQTAQTPRVHLSSWVDCTQDFKRMVKQ